MRRPYYNFLLLILLSTLLPSYGQEDIIGKVYDEAGSPIAFANVLLLKANDTVFIKGTITEDSGAFQLPDIPQGRYRVSASMLGFRPKSTDPFEFDGSSRVTLPPITLAEGLELDEVVVTSKKNLYVQKIDRMVINVASSILSGGSSALEILERSPGVLVDRQNSSISLLGKSGVVVMINGKQSYMPASSLVSLLEGMNASNIETIELITTPPANFDAEGNAGFINIVLIEQTDTGLNGSYALSFGVGNGTITSNNVNFNYRKNKANLFGNYSFLRDSQGQFFEIDRSFLDNHENMIAILTTSDREPILKSHNIRTGLDYQLSENTVMGLLLWANNNKWTMDAINQSRESENGMPSAFVNLLLTERNQLQNFGSNINLKHNFKENGYFSIDLDFLKYRLENPTEYTNRFFDGNTNFLREELTQSDKTTPIGIMVGKTDYSNRISDKVKLDLGIKGAFSNFDNEVDVGTFQGSDFVEDPELTETSSLKERILAGYGSIDYTISDKTSLQVGLRYEHTDSELISDKQGEVVDRSFGELFPTAYLSHKVNDSLSFNFSYSRRITRPTFNDMAPFVIFIDPTTFFAGNPAVQPAISNSVKLDLNYLSFIFSAQYSVEDGTISRFQSRFDEANERLVFGASNLDHTKIFTLSSGLPTIFTNWWKMQNNITYLNTRISNRVDGSLLNFDQNTFNINHTQSFTMSKNLSSEINVNYNSPSIMTFTGTDILEAFYAVNFGIQKKFGERGGTLSFKVNDLLDSMKWKLTNDNPEQNLNTTNTFDMFNRTFLFTYTNSFGNSKLKSARQRGTGAEEEKNRVQ
ncbi:Outer membrane receptor proteins, mostly Fe transport [Pricia antarctica]|uniref:Outer membrane receptor proteins, mostly Fe transport n=1 Tax=Pricia antarctica TaxID=641691 RepID=A0A1G7GMZ8_9FLAO|nr:outer membrane beta-barrel family protein [Pricia antarctica]SDE89535.1 Outer membrane receptor proteins, mostly Fe transport [Pricia antarctica]